MEASTTPRLTPSAASASAAFLVYLGAGLLVTRAVWSAPHPSMVMLGELGDPGQGVWFLGWVPHALAHGLNPFFSSAMFSPRGINLAANVSTPLLGFLLAPVTATAGPVTAFDLGVMLAPVLTAFSTFVVLCHYVEHRWAAFFGGAVVGYSAGLTTELLQGHLQVTMFALVPVIAALCYEAVVCQRHSRLGLGLTLGIAIALQGLVGLEPLALLAATVGPIVVLYLIWRPRSLIARWRAPAVSLGVAGGLSSLLLAYPLWFAFAGPRHLPQPVTVPRLGASLESFVVPSHGFGAAMAGVMNGYIGAGVLALVVVGSVVERQSRLVRLLVCLTAISILFELGSHLRLANTNTLTGGLPLPGELLARAPLLGEVWPLRYSLTTALFTGALLAVVLDAATTRLKAHLSGRQGTPCERGARALPVLAGAIAIAIALFECPNPLPTSTVALPALYRSSAVARLAAGTNILTEPLVTNTATVPIVWQAEQRYRLHLADGYGFVPLAARQAGSADTRGAASRRLVTAVSLGGGPVFRLFTAAETGLLPAHLPRGTVAALGRELRSLGVRAVIVTAGDQPRQALIRLEGALARAFGRRARTEAGPGGAVVVAG
ncbi:MAG: glycosyltransferase family protein [Acidimicrobiales bacterium]